MGFPNRSAACKRQAVQATECSNHSPASKCGDVVVYLPDDLMIEIFSRLNLETLLLSCRCLSKFWRDVVDSPSFLNMYTTHSASSKPKSQFLLVDRDRNLIRLTSPNILSYSELPIAEFGHAYSFDICLACDGLFFFKTWFGGKVFIFNPLRGGELLMLPPTKVSKPTNNEYFGMGFDCTTQTYKIVHLYRNSLDSKATEVHELGTTSWRNISAVPPYCVSGTAVSAYGDVHWVAISRKNKIISFDSKEETFRLTPLPQFSVYLRRADLFNFKGFLALSDTSSTLHFDIWVMKDYKKKEWVREYRIEIALKGILEQNLHFFARCFAQIVGAWENGFVFFTVHQDLLYYNAKTRCLKYIRRSLYRRIFSYTCNALSLKAYGKLMVRERHQQMNYFDLVPILQPQVKIYVPSP